MEHYIKAVWHDNDDGTVDLRTEIVGQRGDIIRALASITATLMEQAARQHLDPTFVLTELGRAVGNAYGHKDTKARESATVDLPGWLIDKEGKDE